MIIYPCMSIHCILKIHFNVAKTYNFFLYIPSYNKIINPITKLSNKLVCTFAFLIVKI